MNRRNRWALTGFLAVAAVVLGALVLATEADASSPAPMVSTAGVQVPRCAEDQVISKRLRCLDRDDATTRYQVVSEAGWGYWYDTRYPRARSMRALVPACHRWQMLTRWGGCVATKRGDFRGGWWYHR